MNDSSISIVLAFPTKPQTPQSQEPSFLSDGRHLLPLCPPLPPPPPSCDPLASRIQLTDGLSPIGAMWPHPFPTPCAVPSLQTLAVGLENRVADPSQTALAEPCNYPGEGIPGCSSTGHEPVAGRESTHRPLGGAEGVGWAFPPVPRLPRACRSCLGPWTSWAEGGVVSEDPSGSSEQLPWGLPLAQAGEHKKPPISQRAPLLLPFSPSRGESAGTGHPIRDPHRSVLESVTSFR